MLDLVLVCFFREGFMSSEYDYVGRNYLAFHIPEDVIRLHQ